MKLNIFTTSAACIVVGLAGFLIGKLNSDSKLALSEADQILQGAKIVQSRASSSGESASTRRSSSPRSLTERTTLSMDQRLLRLDDIMRDENALDRNRAMLAWIASLTPSEFESAVAHFRSLGITEDRMGEYSMLLSAWAEIDPGAALVYTTKNTRGGIATNTVLAAWSSRDPDAAIAWAKANHTGDGANPHMVGIIRGMASYNPSRATVLLQEMPFSRERAEALKAIMPTIMKGGDESAKSWISAISDEKLRDGAVARMAPEMAKKNPAGTASWLLSNLGQNSTRSVDEVFGEWAKVDKAAAEQSYKQLPQGDARSRALRGLVLNEVKANPQAAANLMNQNVGDVDDRMVMHFVWNTYEGSPEVASNQINLVQDERRRNFMYERMLGSWMDRDPNAASQWLSMAKVPDSVRNAVLKK